MRKLTFALLTALLIFAGCKAESPTTPTGSTPGTPSGGVTPPTNATLTLTAFNANPVVNSNDLLTATVTQNNQPVPNGTAVQFIVNAPATFLEALSTSPQSAVRTTTNGNGVATATLTSASAGTFTVTATVNNVSKSVTVTFSTQAVTPPPTSTVPTITAVTPASGKPEGGDTVIITGTNFIGPVRVLFDPGTASGQAPREAFVVSSSATQITVVTPSFNVASGTSLPADVIVITQAGTSAEQRVVKTAGFTFASANLTPSIRALSPTSGPIGGGTRVTIFGDNFQQPLQVFFNSAAAQVISITFSQIVVMSPRASDTAPAGSGVVTGPVDVTVKNVNSGKSATMTGGFRYTAKMVITTAGPTAGPFTGGTKILIDGAGFDDPLTVFIKGAGSGGGDVGLQVIKVTGTEVTAITPAIQPTGCSDVSGSISVVNTENGDSADGPQFTFRVPKPLIISVSPSTAPVGGTTNITVLNAFGFARITIGGLAANVTATVVNPDGTTTFTVQIPTTLTLATISCPAGGSAPAPTPFDVTYTSATTGCTDTSPKALTVTPAAAPVFFTNPLTFNPFTAAITQNTPPAPPFPGLSVTPSSQTLQVVNNGTAPLDITAITSTGAGCGEFVFGPTVPPTVTLNQCEALPVTVTFTGQNIPGTVTCTLQIMTNIGTKNFLLVGTSQ